MDCTPEHRAATDVEIVPGVSVTQLERYGQIVHRDLKPHSRNLAILMKEMHGGSAESNRVYRGNKKAITAMIMHQNHIAACWKAAFDQRHGTDNLRFVVDGLSGPSAQWDAKIRNVVLPDIVNYQRSWEFWQEDVIRRHPKIVNAIDSALARDEQTAYQSLAYLSASYGCAGHCLERGKDTMVYGDSAPETIGHITLVRHDLQQLLTSLRTGGLTDSTITEAIEGWRNAKRDEFLARHAYMRDLLLPAGITMYMIGGGHFKHGCFPQVHIVTQYPLEDAFEEAKASYLVIEPHGYSALMQERDRMAHVQQWSAESASPPLVRAHLQKLLGNMR